MPPARRQLLHHLLPLACKPSRSTLRPNVRRSLARSHPPTYGVRITHACLTKRPRYGDQPQENPPITHLHRWTCHQDASGARHAWNAANPSPPCDVCVARKISIDLKRKCHSPSTNSAAPACDKAKSRSVFGARLSATTTFLNNPHRIRNIPASQSPWLGLFLATICGKRCDSRTIGPATRWGKSIRLSAKSVNLEAGCNCPPCKCR